MSLFNSLRVGLLKTSSFISDRMRGILSNSKELNSDTLEKLEELLISMDIGVHTSGLIVKKLANIKLGKEVEFSSIEQHLAQEIERILNPVVQPIILKGNPHVILMCGVNGNGKTTTAGKLAYKYRKIGKTVMLAACDTFRAAAYEQLNIWAERADCSIITGEYGADSASIAYKAVNKAIENKVDVLLIDTAGRLQNNVNLMEELSRMCRIIKKLDNAAPHDSILVLDATTGQNAYSQLEIFNKMVDISGLIITKLDGSAKGGVVVGLAQKYNVKLYAVGIGEGIDDLKEFTARDFAEALVAKN
ncbi:signal recognition particle-docking protein FtsY [Wolbachia endosymbiont of Pentidionis agamae]|uniref:signal recognition particle-docking protein FtsY n=1 Tax=Wolbachia endosymbiont of Pentidionis agamae TaxID=3110435 RepID=UPI002FD5E19E